MCRHPHDVVCVKHGMRDAAHPDGDRVPVPRNDRNMLFPRPVRGIGDQLVVGQLNGGRDDCFFKFVEMHEILLCLLYCFGIL